LSVLVPILVAVVPTVAAALFGLLVYRQQKKTDRKDELIHRRRKEYERYLTAYRARASLGDFDREFARNSPEVIKTESEYWLAYSSLFQFAVDSVLLSVAEFHKFAWMRDPALTGEAWEQEFKSRYANMIIEMRKDAFEETRLDKEQVEQHLPFNFSLNVPTSVPAMAEQFDENNVIRAAGGLVWRDSPRGKELAVIHRSRYGGDCTFPKGKLESGESWHEAALREVREEIGLESRLGSFVGSNTYDVNGVPKVVLFWNMTLMGEGKFKPSEEVKELRWLTVEEALQQLDYPGDRALLWASTQDNDVGNTPSVSKQGHRWRRWYKRFSLSYRRLESSLPPYRCELEALMKKKGAQGCDSETSTVGMKKGWWGYAACDLLTRAEQALNEGREDLGWKCFLASQRMALYGYDPEERQTKAQTVLREAAEKLSSWRKERVEELLSAYKGETQGHQANPVRVYRASEILHEHYSNVYLKQRRLKALLGWLSAIALVAGVVWLFLVPRLWGNPLKADGLALIPSVICWGLLGSAFFSLTSVATDLRDVRIPDMLVNTSVTLARQVVGVVAALAIFVFLTSGLLLGVLASEELTPHLVLAASFVAGFSERLVVRTVQAASR
jgi:8-oxo-dGTP pyrophosphatase MutT (NUDIX family)